MLSTTCSNNISYFLMSNVISGRWVLSSDTICRWKVGTGGGQVRGERRRPEHLGTWAGDNRRRPGEAGQCQDTCTCPLAPDPPTSTSWVDWGGSEISWNFCIRFKKRQTLSSSRQYVVEIVLKELGKCRYTYYAFCHFMSYGHWPPPRVDIVG